MFKIKITEFQPNFAFLFIFFIRSTVLQLKNSNVLSLNVCYWSTAVDQKGAQKGAKTYIFFRFCVGGWLRGRITYSGNEREFYSAHFDTYLGFQIGV